VTTGIHDPLPEIHGSANIIIIVPYLRLQAKKKSKFYKWLLKLTGGRFLRRVRAWRLIIDYPD